MWSHFRLVCGPDRLALWAATSIPVLRTTASGHGGDGAEGGRAET